MKRRDTEKLDKASTLYMTTNPVAEMQVAVEWHPHRDHLGLWQFCIGWVVFRSRNFHHAAPGPPACYVRTSITRPAVRCANLPMQCMLSADA
jgi:hypothetical protein